MGQGVRRHDPAGHDHRHRRYDRRHGGHLGGVAWRGPGASGGGAGRVPRGVRPAAARVLGGEGGRRASLPAGAPRRGRGVAAPTGRSDGARARDLRPARRGLPRHGEWWDVPAQPGSRRRGGAGLRGASREPQADAGRAVPAGGCRGARCRDGARAARSRGARPRAAGAGAGRCRSCCRATRAARARGKRDAGCGKRGAVRRWATRGDCGAGGGCPQAPRRRGGAMTGSGVATVATVGTFDGIHRGHQAVLREVVRRTEQAGRRTSLLVTFDPHPLEVVNPSAAPRLLTLSDEKRVLAAVLGIERVEVVAFTPELARLTPEEFVRDVLRARFGMQELVLGYDHGFGRGRSGDVELVRRLAREDGFVMDVVPAVKDDGQPTSSSSVRTAVAHGDLAAAARGLGRPYSARGRVERGAGRGRTIGVPTINLASPDPRKLMPPDGVYAVRVILSGKGGAGRGGEAAPGERYGGMMNEGTWPTFG